MLQGSRYHLLYDVIKGLHYDIKAPVGLRGELVELRSRSEEGEAQMMQSWVGTRMTAGLGRGLMQEKGPHDWPLSWRLGCTIPHTFPCLKWSTEHGAPEIRTKATPTALVSMTQDSTSHSLLLCVFLNVCIPEHAACPSVRLSAVHACAHMHEQG